MSETFWDQAVAEEARILAAKSHQIADTIRRAMQAFTRDYPGAPIREPPPGYIVTFRLDFYGQPLDVRPSTSTPGWEIHRPGQNLWTPCHPAEGLAGLLAACRRVAAPSLYGPPSNKAVDSPAPHA